MSDREPSLRPGPLRHLETALPIAVVVLVFFLGVLTLSPFAPALLWAVFTAVAVLPLYRGLVQRLGQRRWPATTLISISLIVLVLLPMVILFRSIIGLLPELASSLLEGGRLASLGLDLPPGTPATWIDLWNGLRDDLDDLRKLFGDNLRGILSSFVVEGRLIGQFVVEFVLGLMLATVILHSSDTLGPLAIRAAERLGGAKALDLGRGAVLTIRYTVLGILGSAAVQTGVASFAYWLVGAPHWPLLAFATFLLGLLQTGPILIWGPLAIWLWTDGQTGMAVFLVVWGLAVVGLSDNLVKSLVVARGADLPAILVFLGALGGLFVWGLVGVFLGPVILALCLELTTWWLREDGKPGDGPDEIAGEAKE